MRQSSQAIIPRRFFWLFDLPVLRVALSWRLIHSSLASSRSSRQVGPCDQPWTELLFSPAIWSGQLPLLIDLLWTFS